MGTFVYTSLNFWRAARWLLFICVASVMMLVLGLLYHETDDDRKAAMSCRNLDGGDLWSDIFNWDGNFTFRCVIRLLCFSRVTHFWCGIFTFLPTMRPHLLHKEAFTVEDSFSSRIHFGVYYVSLCSCVSVSFEFRSQQELELSLVVCLDICLHRLCDIQTSFHCHSSLDLFDFRQQDLTLNFNYIHISFIF